MNMDYEKLIDPLCIPVIKILNEDLGVETMFCCQGKSRGEKSHHASEGYIACRITPRSREVILELVDLLSQRLDLPGDVCRVEFRYYSKRSSGGNDFIILRLKKLDDVSFVWTAMEEILNIIL